MQLQAMDLLEQHRRKQNLSADEEDSMQQGLVSEEIANTCWRCTFLVMEQIVV